MNRNTTLFSRKNIWKIFFSICRPFFSGLFVFGMKKLKIRCSLASPYDTLLYIPELNFGIIRMQKKKNIEDTSKMVVYSSRPQHVRFVWLNIYKIYAFSQGKVKLYGKLNYYMLSLQMRFCNFTFGRYICCVNSDIVSSQTLYHSTKNYLHICRF